MVSTPSRSRASHSIRAPVVGHGTGVLGIEFSAIALIRFAPKRKRPSPPGGDGLVVCLASVWLARHPLLITRMRMLRTRTTTNDTTGQLPAAEAATDCENDCRLIDVTTLYGKDAGGSNQ